MEEISFFLIRRAFELNQLQQENLIKYKERFLPYKSQDNLTDC